MADLTEQITQAASDPAAASGDGQSATARPLGELIDADRYLGNKAAAARRRRGLRYSKLTTPGALPDCGRAGFGPDPFLGGG